MQGIAGRAGRRLAGSVCCWAILGVLSGCAGISPAQSPVQSPVQSSAAQSSTAPSPMPAAPAPLVEVALPPSLLSGFPNGSAPSLSRFLSRTLETAPDGESRRWPTNDPSVSLIVRADATEIADDTLCRRATIILDRPRGERRIAYRACRTATGMWQPSEGPGRRLAGPELISAP